MKTDNSGISVAESFLPANFDMRREAWLIAYAETSCQIVERLCALLTEERVAEGSLEYFAMLNTIYVVYGRPFHRCAGVGRLEKSDIPVDRHATHDHMMTFRDKVYGHKDTKSIQIDADYTANEVRAAVAKDGKMRIFCTELYTRPPKLADIHTHASLLQEHFGRRIKDLMASLLPGGRFADGRYMYDGEFLLSVDFREDVPFKRIPDGDAYIYRKT